MEQQLQAPPAAHVPVPIESPADAYNIMEMAVIQQQQVGIWADGNNPGFLYMDFQGLVWKVEPGSICHLRDAGRATGKPGIHWFNSTPPPDFAFDKAQEAAYIKKSRWTGVQNTNREPPVCDAGQDATLILPNNFILLDGSNSYDKTDQKYLQYFWEINSATEPLRVHIDNPTSAITNVTFDKEGTYSFNLKVTNRAGVTSIKTITVQVLAPIPPIAIPINDAPRALKMPVGNIILNGSSLIGTNPLANVYVWEQLAGPTMPVIMNADKPVANVSGLSEGNYKYQVSLIRNDTKEVCNKGIIELLIGNVQPAPAAQPATSAQSSQQSSTALPAPQLVEQQLAAPPMAAMPQVPQYNDLTMPYVHSSLEKEVDLKKLIPGKISMSTGQIILVSLLVIGIGYAVSRLGKQ